MFILFFFVNSLFANEVIIELGYNKYQITDAKFYETAADANNANTGFKTHLFYKKYAGFIQEFTPNFQTRNQSSKDAQSVIVDFDYCISEKLRMRYNSTKKKRNLPFNSLQASALACHAQLFPRFSVAKQTNENEEIVSANGEYSLYLEAALLTAKDPEFFKEIQAQLKPAPFGSEVCLNFNSSNPHCTSKSTRCSLFDMGNTTKCSDEICGDLGKPNHIYINRSFYGKSPLEEFVPIAQRLGISASMASTIHQKIKSYDYQSPGDESIFCIKCPAGTHPSEVAGDCLRSDGCSLLKNLVYSKEFGHCISKDCKQGSDHSYDCPESCKTQCEKNIKVLQSYLDNFLNSHNITNDSFMDLMPFSSREIPGSRTTLSDPFFRISERIKSMDRVQLNLVIKETISVLRKRIIDYDKQKEGCSNLRANMCYGFASDLETIVEQATNCEAGEIFSIELSSCFKAKCKSCLDKVKYLGALNQDAFYADNLQTFSTCGHELTASVFNDYLLALTYSFKEEVKKCQTDLAFDCKTQPEITVSQIMGQLSGAGYRCLFRNPVNTKKSSIGADKP